MKILCQNNASIYLSTAIILLMAGSTPMAQESGSLLEEVTVVAQRRVENLQDVPIAVSAMSEAMIEKADIHDLTDIATRVPSLTFSPFSPGQNIVALRGVSSNDDGAGTDNSVAVFVDEVYLGRVSNINPEMFDIERVEVLRGPQGTLYGKNTTGGAINIISTRPNTDRLTAKARANFGNFDRTDFAGLVTGPLTDKLAGKASFSYRKRDGWVDNVVLNKEQKDDDTQAYRGQLLYTADRTEVMLTGDYNRLDVEDMARIPQTQLVGALPPIVDGYRALCGNRGPDCSTNPSDGFADREAWGVSMHVTHDFDIGELKSITAYRENEVNWVMDSVGAIVPLSDIIDDRTDQFSQELRWSGNTDRTQYVFGFWYLNEETDRFEVFDINADRNISGSDRYRQINETNSFALFGQADVDLTDTLTLTVGGRYSYERKEIENDTNAGDFTPIAQTFSNTRKESWTSFIPKISLAWQPWDATTIYATAAEGFKSGGFPAAPQRIEDTEPLDQEEATTFEIGFKSDLQDNLRINAAIFHAEYDGLQIQSFGPIAGCVEDLTTPQIECFGAFQTFNAGDARAIGLEAEFTWLPVENLTLSGFISYMDTKFTDAFIPASAFPNQTGQDLIRAPELKYNINADYVWSAPMGGEIAANMSYRFTDDQRGELEPYAIQPSFDILDARLAWISPGDTYEVAFWGKNLLEEDYITHLYTIGGEVIAVFGDPRMYGVSLTWRYD